MMKTEKHVKLHVRKGDFVTVLSGDDKGRKGKVLKVFSDEGRLIVEGICVAKKHARPTQKMPQGGTIDKELPLPISKVMLLCPACKKPTRITHIETANGYARVCKNCNEVIDK
jgi:large subunit ribosomal protein L24